MIVMSMAMERRKIGPRLMGGAMARDRPYIVPAPAHGVSTTSECSAILEVRRDRTAGMTEPGKGILSVFSDSEFSIKYAGYNGSGAITGVVAAVVPAIVAYEIIPSGITYLFRSSDRIPGGVLNAPVGYTRDYVDMHLDYGRANKLAVPVLMNHEGMALGGEKITSQHSKRVVIGPIGQELSAGNHKSPQTSHKHKQLVETYTTLSSSGMTLYYEVNGRVESIEAAFGDTIIVPAGIAHKARMHGKEPTFVTMTSTQDILGDKVIVPVDLERRAQGGGIKNIRGQ